MYDHILAEIDKDPEAFIRERRLTQIAALKLYIPAELRAQRRNRRLHWDAFETAMREQKKREIEIAYAIKHERDPITNKPVFPNRESRESESQDRLHHDAAWNRWETQRGAMYASVKKLDEEIDYYERIDHSFIEIMAMFTALIEYETRTERVYPDATSTRSGKRASRRASMAAGHSQDSSGVA